MKELPKGADTSDGHLKKLKPADKDQYIKDSKVAGLVFRLTKGGKKVWQLRYTVKVGETWTNKPGDNWKDRKTTIASFDDGTGTAAARKLAEDKRTAIRGGADPVAEKQAMAEQRKEDEREREQEVLSRVTMRDLFENWQKLKLQNPKNGHKDGGVEAGRVIRQKVLQKYGDMEVSRFGVAEFHTVADPVLEKGHNRAANVLLALTKQMLNFAVTRSYIASNPLALLTRDNIGGSDTERDRVLCEYEHPDTHQTLPDELADLFQKLPDSGLYEMSQAAVHLCVATCCRIGELLKARWADVDLAAAEWKIPAENSKNGKPHLVNLSDYALHYFARLHELTGGSEWVYPASRGDGHIDPKTITKQIGDRQRASGSPYKGRSKKHDALILPRGKWGPHDLRRTGATMMAERGVMGAVIERCLNHREANRMARIYNRHNPREEMKEAWRLLGAELQRLAGMESLPLAESWKSGKVASIGAKRQASAG